MDNGSNSIVELGRFITGFLVVMGVGECSELQSQLAVLLRISSKDSN